MSELNVNKLIELVELNIGSWKPEAIVIVDVNYKIWGEKGIILKEVLDYYRKFPLSDMHVGDILHNSNTFLMKITEKTGIIVAMKDPQVAKLAAINLGGRINAFSEFYTIEKFVKEKDKKSILGRILGTGD
nr:hypothetical protein [Candidatus Freyarchaeota archaeon]